MKRIDKCLRPSADALKVGDIEEVTLAGQSIFQIRAFETPVRWRASARASAHQQLPARSAWLCQSTRFPCFERVDETFELVPLTLAYRM